MFCSTSYAQNSNYGDSLTVQEMILCKDVIEREPVDVVQTFDLNDDRGWVFARVDNGLELTTCTFRWILNEEVYAEIPVRIGESDGWRTYSNVNLREGFWIVQFLNPEDSVLREIRFNVSE